MSIKTIYHFTVLTGGTATALDSVDGNSLLDLDRAFVIASSTFYAYELDADSGAVESSPHVISPDTNAGTKRWILIEVYPLVSGLTTQILVGGGAGIAPVWTTATGTGAPVRQVNATMKGLALAASTVNSSFTGTISAASLTATFTQAADYNLCRIGSTIISNAQTRYVCKLLGSLQVTLDQTTTWAASSAITSIQAPQSTSDLSGTVISFTAANGSITTILASGGSILFHRTIDGNEGIGTMGPDYKLTILEASTADQSLLSLRGLGAAATGSVGLLFGYEGVANYNKGGIFFSATNEGNAKGSLIFATSNITGAATVTKADARMTIDNAGNVGITETTPTISDGTGLHLGGKIIRIATSKTPASAGAAGNAGEMCWDANYEYRCIATNSWTRAAHAAW